MKSRVLAPAAAAPIAIVALLAAASAPANASTASTGHKASSTKHFVYSKVTVHRNGKKCSNVQVTGITSSGTIVGTVFCGRARGFIKTPGYGARVFKAPGSSSLQTKVTSISNTGIVSLFTQNSGKTPTYTSYLRSATGHYTKIISSLAGPGGIEVLSVNSHSEVVGDYYDDATKPNLVPFIDKSGTIKNFSIGIAGAKNVILTGVGDHGAIAGQYSTASGVARAFTYSGRTATKLKVPHAPTTQPLHGAGLSSLASLNLIAGEIYRKTSVVSFISDHGTFLSVKVPGYKFTYAEGVNSHRVVVGYTTPSASRSVGFIARLEH